MSTPTNAMTAFESTDPRVTSTPASLSPISRCVLTYLSIDPSLVRPTERDRLRFLVSLTAANPGNDLIGRGFRDVRELWRRGFPVPAFDDDTLPMVGIGDASKRIEDIRVCLDAAWPRPQAERAHVLRLLTLLGYDLMQGEGM